MYKVGDIVEYIGGVFSTSVSFQIGDRGVINDNMQIVWENGKISKPMSKRNSLIEVIKNGK